VLISLARRLVENDWPRRNGRCSWELSALANEGFSTGCHSRGGFGWSLADPSLESARGSFARRAGRDSTDAVLAGGRAAAAGCTQEVTTENAQQAGARPGGQGRGALFQKPQNGILSWRWN